MIINALLSKDGLRAANIDVSVDGVALGMGPKGLVPMYAESVEGTILLTLEDLSRALARPAVVDSLLAGVSGLTKPKLALDHGANGGVRFTGSIGFLGRRFPISASTQIHIEDNHLVLSATDLRGLPMVRALPMQLLDIRLPLHLPLGLEFTGVTAVEDGLLVSFSGHDVRLDGGDPEADTAEQHELEELAAEPSGDELPEVEEELTEE